MLGRLVSLAGHKAVVALLGRLGDVARGAAREHRHALDLLRPIGKDEGRAVQLLLDER